MKLPESVCWTIALTIFGLHYWGHYLAIGSIIALTLYFLGFVTSGWLAGFFTGYLFTYAFCRGLMWYVGTGK